MELVSKSYGFEVRELLIWSPIVMELESQSYGNGV